MGRLLLISNVSDSSVVRRLTELAEHLGATCDTINFKTAVDSDGAGFDACVIEIGNLETDISESLLSALCTWVHSLKCPVLYIITDTEPYSVAVLQSLTENIVERISYLANSDTVSFERSARIFAEELAGSIHKRRPTRALAMQVSNFAGCSIVMRVGVGTAFVAWSSHGGSRFAWSTPLILDPVKPIDNELQFEEALDQVLPFVMFMRRAFGNAIWSNPNRDAGFIIDDPLLVPRYGFIDFATLLRSARLNLYHVTLAFIPWNSWRIKARNAELFREYSDCFSLCVHGCDHNRNEYGQTNYSLLVDKNRVALERMERLSRDCGIPFVALMICPQEQCSREGWQSFADTPGLLGMVNTGCVPRNVVNDRVSVCDLLQPIHDRFFGFPIFKRYYPGKPEQFALTAFLGRPAIMVEHHAFLRNGLGEIEDFVLQLRNMCPRVKWRGMEDIATTTHLRRTGPDGTLHVRFFAERFRFEPLDSKATSIRFRKYVEKKEAVEAVFANGVKLPFSFEGNYLVFAVDQATPLIIRLQLKRPPLMRVYSNSPYRVGVVAIRRLSSEFRDNVLARFPLAARCAGLFVRSLRLTGGNRAPL